ncbi:type II toxin-antitoxin system RelB/DinJ family antitoxin [bacterium]|nr:type II toxin-antitoxin system RelB/DinJ family antitoxin [bacterium]
MSSNATLSVRTDKETKKKAEKILKSLGLNHSTAINIFYHLIVANSGLPFDVRIPNKETLQAMQDLDNNTNIDSFDSTEKLFDDLGI